MRIAYLSAFYPYRGGIAQFNACLYRAFEDLGHEMQAYTFSRQYPSLLFPGSTQFVQPNDGADPIPAKRVLDSINPVTYFTAGRQIAKFKPDLLMMKYWMPFLAPAMGTAARMANTKTIAVLGNVTPHEHRPGDALLNRYYMNSCHAFVAMSSSVKADLLSIRPDALCLQHPHPLYGHFGQPMPKAEAQQRLGLHPHKKTLLFFGLIRHYKGLDILLHAFKQLDDSYQLLIAGESYEDFASYRSIYEGHACAERVFEHVRYIPDTEVPMFFSAADACVLPYRSATQSGVVAASLHFSCPVIVTDVGGLREAVEPYKAGLVVSNPSHEAIAEAILQLFKPEQQWQQQIALFKAQYSWHGLAQKIIALSQQIK